MYGNTCLRYMRRRILQEISYANGLYQIEKNPHLSRFRNIQIIPKCIEKKDQ